ncbi:MAG: AraC family transcriptional regulator [Candidatus Thiodiazotropha sp.]|jgi:AraC-like DNA-binding protein
MKNRDEFVKFFNLPFPNGVEAVTGTNVSNIFKRHIHKVYIIGKVIEGKRVITIHESSVKISKEEIFIINPGQAHSCESSKEGGNCHSYQVLSVSPDIMKSLAKQISEKPENNPYFEDIKYHSKELAHHFGKIFQLFEIAVSQLEIEAEINSILSKLILQFSKVPPKICLIGNQENSVKRVCDYIANHYPENLSLNQLSQIACLSPFHFQRVFTQIMGISAHDYLIHYRISESKKMLLKSKDIADIANETGFADQSHFSKTFKKTVGIPPGKYIKFNQIR